MIDIKKCELLTIVPQVYKQDIATQVTSYALNKTARMLFKMIDMSSVYAAIDILPEQIIDLLAEELRAQYYDTSLPENGKKEAVKKALPWHCRAGTVSAVTELTDLIWISDNAAVEEWFNYSAAPYLFRVILEAGVPIEEKKIDDFLAALQKVKNTRSHLDAIVFKRKINSTLYVGTTVRSHGNIIITDVWKDEYRMNEQMYYGISAECAIQRIRIREE